MKARYLVLALAAAFSANAVAGEDILGALADETGLTKRQVKMVVGPRSSHAAYIASYDQVQRQFVNAVGRSRYEELLTKFQAKQEPQDERVASVEVAEPRS